MLSSITCEGHAALTKTPVLRPAASHVKSISTPSSSPSSMPAKSGRLVSPYISLVPSRYVAMRQWPIRAVPKARATPPGAALRHASSKASSVRSRTKSAYSSGVSRPGFFATQSFTAGV